VVSAVPVLFDTVILIDYLNSIPQAKTAMDRYSDRAISVITWMEVMAGSTTEDEVRLRSFLQNFRLIALESDIAERGFQVRRDRKIKLPDAIIQASAELFGRTILTRNTRDFPESMVGVIIPYRI
jgi:predicted nucleic acid-binding protein